jgi:hypothetical protein
MTISIPSPTIASESGTSMAAFASGEHLETPDGLDLSIREFLNGQLRL